MSDFKEKSKIIPKMEIIEPSCLPKMSENDIKCAICNVKFQFKEELKKHLWNHCGHTSEEDFKEATDKNLQEQLKDKFRCETCAETFVEQSDFNSHVWKHSGLPNNFLSNFLEKFNFQAPSAKNPLGISDNWYSLFYPVKAKRTRSLKHGGGDQTSEIDDPEVEDDISVSESSYNPSSMDSSSSEDGSPSTKRKIASAKSKSNQPRKTNHNSSLELKNLLRNYGYRSHKRSRLQKDNSANEVKACFCRLCNRKFRNRASLYLHRSIKHNDV